MNLHHAALDSSALISELKNGKMYEAERANKALLRFAKLAQEWLGLIVLIVMANRNGKSKKAAMGLSELEEHTLNRVAYICASESCGNHGVRAVSIAMKAPFPIFVVGFPDIFSPHDSMARLSWRCQQYGQHADFRVGF